MAIRAILGIGNPGKEYEKTYHSVGKWVAEKLQKKYKTETGSALDSTTHEAYVNVSSQTARALLRNKPYGPDSLLVVHDDSDLARGQYKLVFGGGSAGHKGVQDLINLFSPENFWRLRIGVRDQNEKTRKKAGDFILQKWSKTDEGLFKKALTNAWEELKTKELI